MKMLLNSLLSYHFPLHKTRYGIYVIIFLSTILFTPFLGKNYIKLGGHD